MMGWNPEYDVSKGINDFAGRLEERINYYK